MSLPLLLAIQSGYVRIAFRVYFTIGFILIGFLANICRARRNHWAIANGTQVPLPAMTGWLTNMSLLTAIWRLRRMPGGVWLGSLMVVCTVLSYLSDLAVSGLVRTVTVSGRCPFGTGLVVATSRADLPDVTGLWEVPPTNGAPFFVVSQAQLTSVANGGLVGIYWKANRDLTFRADTLDVAGQWNCTDVNNDISYYPDVSVSTINKDLFQRGYLYHSQTSSCWSDYGNGSYAHLLFLDSNAPAYQTGFAFDVRASIDLSAGAMENKVMKSFHCTMSGDGVQWVQLNLNSTGTLDKWTLPFQANVYDGSGSGANNDSGLILEQYLNTMIMVAGGDNYLLNTPPSNGTGGGNTQGCLIQQTSIPVEIIILFALVTILVGGMVLDLLILTLIALPPNASWKRLNEQFLRKVNRETPNDLVDWMSQAVRERGGLDDTEEIEGKTLRLWVFGRRDNKGRLGVGLLGRQRQPNRPSSLRVRPSSFVSTIEEEEELRRYV